MRQQEPRTKQLTSVVARCSLQQQQLQVNRNESLLPAVAAWHLKVTVAAIGCHSQACDRIHQYAKDHFQPEYLNIVLASLWCQSSSHRSGIPVCYASLRDR